MTGLFIALAFWSYNILDAITWQNNSKERTTSSRFCVLLWAMLHIVLWGITAAMIVKELHQ